jgi:hypothetical protein
VLAPNFVGVALIRQGKAAEGDGFSQGRARGLGGKWRQGQFAVLQIGPAEGMAQLGDLDGALHLIDEIIEQVERPGWEERVYYAETLRVKGWLFLLKCDLEGAERNYLASLGVARHQQAKSWELRTAMRYARLMRDQGRTKEAYELLAPIYGWFTEGFGTKDLRDAKALLGELTAEAANGPHVTAATCSRI